MFSLSGVAQSETDNQFQNTQLEPFVEKAMNDSGLSEFVVIVTSWEISEEEYFGEMDATSRAIMIKGKSAEENNTLSKIPIGNDYEYLDGGTTETCTGVSCEHCDFPPAPAKGCWCVRSPPGESGKCNHTITKN